MGPNKKEVHCPYCRRRLRFRKDGIVRRHVVPGEGMCPQGGKRLGAPSVPSKIQEPRKPYALEYEGTFEPQSGPNGECLICGGIEACKPGCKDGDFGIP